MKNKKILIPALAVTALAVLVCLIIVVRRNMPSKEYMSLNDYYNVSGNEMKVILQDSIYETPALYEDGQIYVDTTLVSEQLNERFYYDSHENLLLYTTSTAVISASLDSNECYINKSKQTKDYTIVKVKDDTVYINLDFVKEYTALTYQKYENPNRVVITYKFGDKETWATTTDDTKLRYESDIKSDILVDVEKDNIVHVLEDEVSGSGFSKVITTDGVIGYIKSKDLGGAYEYTPETDFVKEEYSHILMDGKVNLVWHQVTNQTANDGLVELLASTKDVNVVSPTWFATSDNSGSISSLASYSYVEKAHAAGVQVWALCDDFAANMKIGKVLARTSRRQRLEKNLLAEAIRYDLDGINIDFENVKKASGHDFIQFIRELGIMCRNNGIVLSVDNYPPADYSAYYNREEQAAVADYVITMAYDEYYAGSEEAGPVSSITYVQDAVTNTLAQVPADQTIIALPFYSRMWTEKTVDGTVKLSSEACSMTYAEELVKDAGVTATWDDTTGLYYAEYTKKGTLHKIWLENAKSLELKLQAVSDGGVAGAAFWKLGMEKDSVWNVVDKYMSDSSGS